MAKVIIDGFEVEVPDGTSILNAARTIGGDIVPPAMCYYTSLQGSGGKCRTCLVRAGMPMFDPTTKEPVMDETTGKQKINYMPKLVASCSTPVSNGMVIENITNPAVLETRKSIVEFLLINHPLDCPVCDQAGECSLQDLAFEHGAATTRYEEDRREFEKVDIGDYVQLHMTRCILCYRCVYTADQLTKKRVHGVLNRGDASEIGTYIKDSIDNEFSGNIIDVCPVGALTDKTFRFKSRVWFLKPMDATCDCKTCSGKAVVWTFGNEIYRVTARKDQYGEVKDFICNDCRYHKKEFSDWKIEGPRHIDRHSVISQNHYESK